MRHLALPVAFTTLAALSACVADETLSGYAGAGSRWELREIDGTPFPAAAFLEFPEPGVIAGEAPCNRFSGRQTAPYPWFQVERLLATRRACPALAAEQLFLDALAKVTLAEVQGDTLLLSDPAGPVMVFERAQP